MKIIECGKHDIDYSTFLRVQWSLTNKCNYKCKYCESYNSNEEFSDLKTINKIINFIKLISNKKQLDLRLFGGEPTFHPEINYILNNVSFADKVLVWTNLSRSINFYKSISKISRDYRCSFHPKYANINEFIDKLIVLKSNKDNNIFVNVMISPDNFNEVISYYKQIDSLSEKNINLNCSLDKIYYLNEKFTRFQDIIFLSKQIKCINNGYYIKYIKDSNIKILNIPYNYITDNNINCFYNYKCNTISNSIFIDYNGDVYNCVTYKNRNIKPIFNIITDDIKSFFNIQKIPQYCKVNKCTCEYDIKKIKGE